jgi:hypothetical protein
VFNEGERDAIENVARYLGLSAVSIRSENFFLGGEWCRAGRYHASLLPVQARARALLLCEALSLLGQEAEGRYRSPKWRRGRKRGPCLACGKRGVVIYEIRKFGFLAEWACRTCAAEIEGDDEHGQIGTR